MSFNKVVLGLGLTLSVMQLAQAGLPNGISSGDTTQTSTVLWARSSAGLTNFKVLDAGSVVFEQAIAVIDPLVPAKMPVSGLSAGKTYDYEVTSADGEIRTGSFKTAAAAGTTPALSFGVTGDWRGELAPYPAISNVPAKSLDFFVKLGDTIYADYATPDVPLAQAKSLKQYRLKHKEVYSERAGSANFAKLQKDVSIFAAIDDHEVMNDFAGGAPASSDSRFPKSTGLINQSAFYNNGLQAFTEYNAITDQRYPVIGDSLTDNRPNLYRAQRYGSTAAFYMLDARSFRDQELPAVADITSPTQIGGFIAQSFDIGTGKNRTLLGKRQLDQLKADLLSAQADNVAWKFVAIPEPIQNLGVLIATDRFEGYAAERSELLRFIDENNIKNVVFISADIHGTIINDLTYQRREDVLNALLTVGNPLAAPQIKTSAFEITTGSVAFEPAFGDAVIGLLGGIPNGDLLLGQLFAAVGVADAAGFNALPMAYKNGAMQAVINQQLTPLGYTPVGLKDNKRIKAKLLQGTSTAVFSFGWTQFDIKPDTLALKITTYGINPYTAADLAANTPEIISRTPEIVSELLVLPQP